jgi:uncharacterized protein (DUF362 family)
MSNSSVTYIQNHQIRNNKKIEVDVLKETLIFGLESHFKVKDYRDVLSKLFSPKHIVAIKVNCLAGRGLSTNPELVQGIIFLLEQIGLSKKNIIVFDRADQDLKKAGFKITTSRTGVRCAGNDHFGYYRDLFIHKSIGSMISQVLVDADAIINVPVLKDHGIVGISCAMKNFFGVIHNPNKYHLNVGNPYVADLCSSDLIKDKVKLNICDAITAQYEAGPPFMPQYSIKENALIISEDMVALDRFGWGLIENWRKKNQLPSLKQVGREPSYIFTAADDEHQIGEADINHIKVNKIRL